MPDLPVRTADRVSTETLRFVVELAKAVSGPPLELPSYPEVSLRLQRLLGDANASSELVERVVSADPVLASRIVAMANSAALSHGHQTASVREAIARLGFDALRTAAIAFAMTQLHKADAYRDLARPLTSLWQRNLARAAMGYVLARKIGRLSPDAVMLAGLLSGVGRLYLLTRAKEFPFLFSDPVAMADIEQQWHAQIARSILENWHLADETIEAVAACEGAAFETTARSPLTDHLSVALTLVASTEEAEQKVLTLSSHRAAHRLGLADEPIKALLAAFSTELRAVQAALGH